jgi:2'-5' RNA ligase
LRIAGLGLFGGTKPHNLHASVAPDSSLMEAQTRLERLCRNAGLEIPRRKFIPHVTLAYLRATELDLAGLEAAVARDMGFATEAFTPDVVSLFRVHQGKRGNSYDVIARYPLLNR